jgi:phosphoglucomutase
VNTINPRAGQLANASDLVDVPKLITAYFELRPDPHVPEQRVAFGTSGHRGSSFDRRSTNGTSWPSPKPSVLYRQQQKIDGPLFLGIDTHALSTPAPGQRYGSPGSQQGRRHAGGKNDYTPTPAISHAILTYNHGRKTGLADGIVVTPSHNPPESGGFKYNPTHGGPGPARPLPGSRPRRMSSSPPTRRRATRSLDKALVAPTTHRHDYLTNYVKDLANIIDMEAIRASGIRFGVNPLGGAGVHYWGPIAEHYGLNMTLVSDLVDPTFRFMTLDWDGKIRMDPSSKYAMQSLIDLKDKFDVAVACDTDHDRHGIVTRSRGLLPANHYLAVCISYLFAHRPNGASRFPWARRWSAAA